MSIQIRQMNANDPEVISNAFALQGWRTKSKELFDLYLAVIGYLTNKNPWYIVDKSILEDFMVNLARDLKPVSYVQDHTVEILDYVESSKSPVVITKDGEAKAVIIDIESYQKTLNAINLAKLLSFGEKDIKKGNLISHEDAKKMFENTLAGKKE